MNALRVGLLIGWRQLQRASLWTTGLIVFVMMITFLNLVAVSGILVGLIVGSERAFEEKSSGSVIITALDDEDHVVRSDYVSKVLDKTPGVANHSIRYDSAGTITADHRNRQTPDAEPNQTGVRLVGIDPIDEEAVTNLSENIVEGEYFYPNDSATILLGALNLERYTAGFADISGALTGVQPGDTVLLTIGDVNREFTVRGIIDAKVGEVSSSVFIPERELRRMIDKTDDQADRIAISITPTTTAAIVKASLMKADLDAFAEIQTFNEALPKFLIDIKNTFNVLGTFVGAIGIVVASITIFIIIFINALARRQQIGILKGIGIDRRAIEIAYVFQAAVYAILGAGLGTILVYGFLINYFDRNPIDFPFSDGILVAEPISTLIRFAILFFITLIAGFIPAWMIVRQNTLNSILGRK